MRVLVLYAREPALPRAIYKLASAEALGGSPEEAVKLRIATFNRFFA
jgi:hypothetical protein